MDTGRRISRYRQKSVMTTLKALWSSLRTSVCLTRNEDPLFIYFVTVMSRFVWEGSLLSLVVSTFEDRELHLGVAVSRKKISPIFSVAMTASRNSVIIGLWRLALVSPDPKSEMDWHWGRSFRCGWREKTNLQSSTIKLNAINLPSWLCSEDLLIKFLSCTMFLWSGEFQLILGNLW